MANELRKFSIVIPVPPGGKCDKALESLRNVKYPSENIEIFVAEGFRPGKQRNAAVQQASGDVIYFIDDDSMVHPKTLQYINETMDDYPDAKVIGGPALIGKGGSFFQKLIPYVLSSIFGTGSGRNRYTPIGHIRKVAGEELIACNLAIEKESFTSVGGFPENLFPNEENFLMNKLNKSGYAIYYHPLAYVTRENTDSVFGYFSRITRYGRGRMQHFMIKPSFFEPIFLAPLFFIAYLVCFAIWPIWPMAIPLLLYANLALMASFFAAAPEKKIFVIPILPFMFFFTHLFYAFGLLVGFIKGLIIFKTKKDTPVSIKHVKRFSQMGF